ncbi:MAG: acyl-CoA dehydrogenase [Rhodospirillaceae bacterium]|nr:acyl-CoA dehydrogenase [Rhodospirillaceae bacterium]
MTEVDIDHLKTWVGKDDTSEERSCVQPIHQYYGLLDKDDRPQEGDPMGPMCHYFFFKPLVNQSKIGPDGHPARGDFMPPVPLPRRMFAGASITYNKPLIIGETHKKIATIEDVTMKKGSTGALIFCKVRQDFYGEEGDLALSEVQNIVYRGDPPKDANDAKGGSGQGKPAPDDHAYIREITPDPVMLYRYSSSTWNTHRIHYDRTYVMEEEGYPGLVVHGPLAASLLAELALDENLGKSLKTFRFQARSPLFDTAPFKIAGKPTGEGAELWSITPEGAISTFASATFM